MYTINVLETHKRLVCLGIELKRKLFKSDVDAIEDLPSYNTLLRAGVRLLKVNAEIQHELSIKICSECFSEYSSSERHSRFCSSSCAATYTNQRKRRFKWTDAQRLAASKHKDPNRIIAKSDTSGALSSSERQPSIKSACLHCGKTVSNSASKYCSQKCSTEARKAARDFRYLSGADRKVTNDWLYGFLVRTRGNKCSVCGIEHWNDRPIRLEVEHSNGNSDDNDPENVCLICPNCHSQTDTYKGKNRGQGRHARRQRYVEGKSY